GADMNFDGGNNSITGLNQLSFQRSLTIDGYSGGGRYNANPNHDFRISNATKFRVSTTNISYTNLSMDNNDISNIQHLLFGGPQIRSSSTILAADAPEGLNLQVSGVDKLRIRGNLVMYAALDTNGYAVIGDSDARLKHDIVDDEINSIEAIKNWRMAGFNWIDTDKPQDRQFSVIAQSA